ncbi:uncharacterized protein B0I36DRAFT_133143 [Microdochium trichocladiopsis]|uniref:Uncharacterized protein n=1 Tax=Microdochium trichocladiopsis TaxID=1682393 RepID=A0A9P8Y4L9_9PEZI|nr:uncharacterized protein B0I36DRAFT_133143 [Microdochium trichocladiopsis]KAH7029477.1 hypothetical protein B0I36DRAFT_133143 [Microdochium trichocladiopsis]
MPSVVQDSQSPTVASHAALTTEFAAAPAAEQTWDDFEHNSSPGQQHSMQSDTSDPSPMQWSSPGVQTTSTPDHATPVESDTTPADFDAETLEEQREIDAARGRLYTTIKYHPEVRFFLEIAPTCSTPASCRRPLCGKAIECGAYRVTPRSICGSATMKFRLYHLRCFEQIADLEHPDFIKLLTLVTRNTFTQRIVKGTDGRHLLDVGAERLAVR